MKANSDIIILDSETTGLDAPYATKIESQPYITEIYIVRVDKNFNFIEDFETMLKPPIPISEEITKITGITEDSVKDAPSFIEVYDKIYDIFECCRNVVGHNIMFDLRMVYFELFRFNLERKFPWPKNHICTIEYSKKYFNKRLKLMQLYEHLFAKQFVGAHRAKNDVEATAACFFEMVRRGDIKINEDMK